MYRYATRRGSPGARVRTRRCCSTGTGSVPSELLVVLLPVVLGAADDVLRRRAAGQHLLERLPHRLEHRGRRPVREQRQAAVLDQLVPALLDLLAERIA